MESGCVRLKKGLTVLLFFKADHNIQTKEGSEAFPQFYTSSPGMNLSGIASQFATQNRSTATQK